MPNRRLNVFLCHAKEDKPTVRELYRQLTAEGWLDVWLDEVNLFPGQEWDIEIEKAVEQADIVVVCLSTRSLNKEGYVQKELRFVLNIADEKPEGTIFVIPLRLDECVVPRRLRSWQYADYFPKDERARAYERLLVSLRMRAKRLEIPTVDSADKQARKDQEEQERKVAEERARLLAAQKAETERIAREKTETELTAKAEHDRLARQKAEERRKATVEAFRKMDFKSMFIILGIMIATTVCFMGGKFIVDNLPVSPTRTQTPEATQTLEIFPTFMPTFTTMPPTDAPTATVTFTPELGIGSTWTSSVETGSVVMLFVPAGEFTMGNDNGGSDEKPAHSVYLDSYWIDQTEVTNAMYEKCVNAGACQPPVETSSSTHSSYYGNSEFDDFPVIYVSWNYANAYCKWRGWTRLPTEAEWEKAASWDDQTKAKRVYPWGDSIDCSFANYSSCKGDTTKVGSYPSGASFYGVLDMAGNVWEMVADWYQAYPGNTESNSPYGTTYRVLRGGSWSDDDGGSVRSSVRDLLSSPNEFYNYMGFRCASSFP